MGICLFEPIWEEDSMNDGLDKSSNYQRRGEKALLNTTSAKCGCCEPIKGGRIECIFLQPMNTMVIET